MSYLEGDWAPEVPDWYDEEPDDELPIDYDDEPEIDPDDAGADDVWDGRFDYE